MNKTKSVKVQPLRGVGLLCLMHVDETRKASDEKRKKVLVILPGTCREILEVQQ